MQDDTFHFVDITTQTNLEYMNVHPKKFHADSLVAIVDSLPIAISWRGKDLVYQGANADFAALLGYDLVSDIVGKKDADLFDEEEAVSLYESDDETILSTGEALKNFEEIFYNTRLGREVCWRMSKLPVVDDNDEVVGVATVCEDITSIKVDQIELVQLRQDVKKSERMTKAFLANITHSIRTPLSAIMGFTDMITQGELEQDEIVAFSDILQYNADKLNKVISDTLDVASVEAGELVLNPEPVDIKAFIEEEVKAYSNRIFITDKSHIDINAELPEESMTFEVDKVRLKQVLSNLIGNALQFTESGEVTIGLRMDNQKSVLLYVKDTGAGIGAEQLEIIFERFKLGGSVVEDVNSGLGLGLTICKELVNQMGGEIWVESKAGQGAKFSFTLPTGEIDTEAVDSSDYKAYEWQESWAGKKIILADDVIYAHQYIKALLKKKDIEVISAIDGEEAINIADRHQDAALILMDIQMPRMGGIEAMERIKEKYPEWPIIAYTAYAMSGDSEVYLEKGFDDYLSKPLETNELLRVLSRFL